MSAFIYFIEILIVAMFFFTFFVLAMPQDIIDQIWELVKKTFKKG